MGSITSFGKQALKILICFCLVYTPFFASAASIGGWNLSNPVAQGASVLYDAAKNAMINGKNVAKTSTALITPVASDVAKVLARGGAAYALSIAVEQLLGAVDWVLDPANNQIKYKVPVDPSCLSTCSYTLSSHPGVYASPQAACSAFFSSFSGNGWSAFGSYVVDNGMPPTSFGYCSGIRTHTDGRRGSIGARVNTIIDPDKPVDEEKSIPLTTVATQVISNAESEANAEKRATAQVATTAAAADRHISRIPCFLWLGADCL